MASFIILLLVLLHFLLQVGQNQLAGIFNIRIVLLQIYIMEIILSFLWSLKPPPK